MDTINWKILDYLQQNARLSNAEIGRKVGLSSPAVAERIKKMEDYGIIEGYTTKVSYTKTGHQLPGCCRRHYYRSRFPGFPPESPVDD